MAYPASDISDILQHWAVDFSRYSHDLLKIQTMEGELINFKFNEVQEVVEDIIHDIEAQGRLKRLIILKARREGISTYFLARYYHKCSMNFNRYATIITHEPDSSDFLFSITRRYHIHNEIRPQDRYNNKRELSFNTKDGTGLDSSIRVATAGKEDVGSSQLIHYLHLSEVAKWPSHTTDALLTSVMQCVPGDPTTEVVFESTAKGVGGKFYDMYWDSKYQYEIYLDKGKVKWKCVVNKKADDSNEFSSIFIPWFVFKKYSMPVPKDFKRTDEEEHLAKQYGLTDEQLAWRRWCIANNCQGDISKFKQEYPSNPEEAFLSSGTNVFDVQSINMLRKELPKPKMTYDISASTQEFIANVDLTGEFVVWEEPQTGEEYVVSCDVSEGLEKGDFGCIDVVHGLTGRHCAQWHGKRDPDILAHIMLAICRRYNTAWAAPERNNHGLMVVAKLVDKGYPKIWVEKVPDPPNKPRKRYGWLTSRSTKPLIIDNLIAFMRETPHYIRSDITLDEMMTFKRNEKGEFEAEAGRFDDCVMSMAIAQYVRLKIPNIHNRPRYERGDNSKSEKEVSGLVWN